MTAICFSTGWRCSFVICQILSFLVKHLCMEKPSPDRVHFRWPGIRLKNCRNLPSSFIFLVAKINCGVKFWCFTYFNQQLPNYLKRAQRVALICVDTPSSPLAFMKVIEYYMLLKLMKLRYTVQSTVLRTHLSFLHHWSCLRKWKGRYLGALHCKYRK